MTGRLPISALQLILLGIWGSVGAGTVLSQKADIHTFVLRT